MWKGKETYQRKLLLFCARIAHSIPLHTHLISTMMALRDEIFAFYTWTIFFSFFFSSINITYHFDAMYVKMCNSFLCTLRRSFILRWYVMPLVSHVIQHFLWRFPFYFIFCFHLTTLLSSSLSLYTLSKWKASNEEMFVFNISILVSFSSVFCDSFLCLIDTVLWTNILVWKINFYVTYLILMIQFICWIIIWDRKFENRLMTVMVFEMVWGFWTNFFIYHKSI